MPWGGGECCIFLMFLTEKEENKIGNHLKLSANTFFGPKKAFAESFRRFHFLFSSFWPKTLKKYRFRVELLRKFAS